MSYFDKVKKAIIALKERNGSSLPALKKYIETEFGKELKGGFKKHVLKASLKAAVKSGKLVMVKAAQLVQDYVAECLRRGVQPDPPSLHSHWLRGWRRQYRVSLRRPNRKCKVPRHVLEERLAIFWLN